MLPAAPKSWSMDVDTEIFGECRTISNLGPSINKYIKNTNTRLLASTIGFRIPEASGK